MLIEIKKRADGAGVLRCKRDDGSSTWQKMEKHGAHFALHDITHFVIEVTLGYRRGFFGLVAEGWEIEDTTGKGAKGPLPPDALEVEGLVGLFDAERASGAIWTTEEFNEFGAMRGIRALTADEIASIRKKRSELFQKWFAVAPGENLELRYEPINA